MIRRIRLHHDSWIGEVTIHPDPGHFTTTQDLILTHNRDIILGLTSHLTGRAAQAGIEVDRHRPLVIRIELVERH